MNAVNRVLLVVLSLVAIVLCTTALVVPVWLFDAVTRQLTALVDFLRSLRWYVRLPLGVLFALALDIVLVLLIVLEVRKPRTKAIHVQKTAGGEVMISVASIADRLKYEVDRLSGVLRTKPSVSGKRGGVVVELDVETAAGTVVPEKAERIIETAQKVVEEKMGLKLARPPKVKLRVVPYPKVSRASVDEEETPSVLPRGPRLGDSDEAL
jgi:hypothetical protein